MPNPTLTCQKTLEIQTKSNHTLYVIVLTTLLTYLKQPLVAMPYVLEHGLILVIISKVRTYRIGKI